MQPPEFQAAVFLRISRGTPDHGVPDRQIPPGSKHKCHHSDRGAAYYVAYQTDEEWILDRLWETETRGNANINRRECAEIWGADMGFQNGNHKYYLRYPDGILVFTIYGEFEPDPGQISVILEKLGLN